MAPTLCPLCYPSNFLLFSLLFFGIFRLIFQQPKPWGGVRTSAVSPRGVSASQGHAPALGRGTWGGPHGGTQLLRAPKKELVGTEPGAGGDAQSQQKVSLLLHARHRDAPPAPPALVVPPSPFIVCLEASSREQEGEYLYLYHLLIFSVFVFIFICGFDLKLPRGAGCVSCSS